MGALSSFYGENQMGIELGPGFGHLLKGLCKPISGQDSNSNCCNNFFLLHKNLLQLCNSKPCNNLFLLQTCLLQTGIKKNAGPIVY